jgi:hypothetical protein
MVEYWQGSNNSTVQKNYSPIQKVLMWYVVGFVSVLLICKHVPLMQEKAAILHFLKKKERNNWNHATTKFATLKNNIDYE